MEEEKAPGEATESTQERTPEEAPVTPPKKVLKKKTARVPVRRKRSTKTAQTTGSTSARAAKNVRSQLKKIYQTENGKLPDFTRLDRKKSSKKKTKILIGVLTFFLLLAGASWAGFFFFNPTRQFSETDVSVEITGPQKTNAGKEVRYDVTYINAQRLPLGKTELSVRVPDTFVVSSISPKPSSDKEFTWQLGTVNARERGHIEISGVWNAAANSEHTLRAFLTYTPSNFNSEFQKVTSYAVSLEGTQFQVALHAPQKSIPGKEEIFSFTVENKSDTDFKDTIISFIPPEGFIVQREAIVPHVASSTHPTDPAFEWSFKEFSSKTKKEFSAKGTFASGNEGQRTATVDVGLKRKDEVFLQHRATAITELVAANLNIELFVNGSNEGSSVQFDDVLAATLQYENKGKDELKNVQLKLIIDAPSLDEESVLNWSAATIAPEVKPIGESEGSGTRRTVLTWTGKEISKLKKLKAGEKGSIEMSVPFKTGKEIDMKKIKSSQVILTAEATISAIGEQVGVTKLQTKPISLLFNTNLDLKTSTSLQENKTYTITWTLTNSLHEIENVQIATTLPKHVDWKGPKQVPAGDLSYDPLKRKVLWTVNRIPTSVPGITILFTLDLNGENVELTDKIEVEAVDKITKEKVTILKKGLIAEDE